MSVAKRVKAPGSEREVGCIDSNPIASLLLLLEKVNGKSYWLAAKRSAGVGVGTCG